MKRRNRHRVRLTRRRSSLPFHPQPGVGSKPAGSVAGTTMDTGQLSIGGTTDDHDASKVCAAGFAEDEAGNRDQPVGQ
jgi:hypothetical protein